MTITYPYAVSALSARLKIQSIVWDIQRNDELSGTGDGRIYQAELAPPLWMATVTLVTMTLAEAKQIAALIRKLHGAQESFMFFDPQSAYPQSDPKGLLLGSSAVQVNSVSADKDALSLSGLPAGYVVTLGDKMSIAYGASIAFIEVSETATANSSGVTPEFGVFPHVPIALSAGAVVTLIKPACKCIIMSGTHNPGTASKTITDGAGFKAIQKK